MIELARLRAQVLQFCVKPVKLYMPYERGDVKFFHVPAVAPLARQIYAKKGHFDRRAMPRRTRCLLKLMDVVGEMLVQMSIEFLQIVQTNVTIVAPFALQIVVELAQSRHVAFQAPLRAHGLKNTSDGSQGQEQHT